MGYWETSGREEELLHEDPRMYALTANGMEIEKQERQQCQI